MYNPQWHIEALHRLESVNFTREQGETLMELIEERQQIGLADLATKRDIDDLRQATKRDIDDLRQATERDIDDLRQATKRDIDDLRKEIEGVRKDTRHDIETFRLETRLEFEKIRSGMKFYFLGICVVTLLVHKGESLVQLVMSLLR